MRKRPHTPAYVIFYILFLPDTWRILMGVIVAVLLVPSITTPDMGVSAQIMLHVMIATIGYTASGIPARKISQIWKRLILGDRNP